MAKLLTLPIKNYNDIEGVVFEEISSISSTTLKEELLLSDKQGTLNVAIKWLLHFFYTGKLRCPTKYFIDGNALYTQNRVNMIMWMKILWEFKNLNNNVYESFNRFLQTVGNKSIKLYDICYNSIDNTFHFYFEFPTGVQPLTPRFKLTITTSSITFNKIGLPSMEISEATAFLATLPDNNSIPMISELVTSEIAYAPVFDKIMYYEQRGTTKYSDDELLNFFNKDVTNINKIFIRNSETIIPIDVDDLIIKSAIVRNNLKILLRNNRYEIDMHYCTEGQDGLWKTSTHTAIIKVISNTTNQVIDKLIILNNNVYDYKSFTMSEFGDLLSDENVNGVVSYVGELSYSVTDDLLVYNVFDKDNNVPMITTTKVFKLTRFFANE